MSSWNSRFSKCSINCRLTALLSSVAMLLTIIFFVTSSDSGSLIIDTIAAGGKMDAPVVQRVFWCSIEGLIAIALLLGGGLKSFTGGGARNRFPVCNCPIGNGGVRLDGASERGRRFAVRVLVGEVTCLDFCGERNDWKQEFLSHGLLPIHKSSPSTKLAG